MAIVAMGLLVFFTYRSMLSLGFEANASSLTAITPLFYAIASIVVMFFSRNSIQTRFSVLWMAWVIWMFIIFFIFGMRDEGTMTFFYVVFAPLSFLFFYTVSLCSDQVRKIAIYGFIILYALAYYLNIINVGRVMSISIGEVLGVSNLVYWCLCATPILLLVDKQWIKSIVIALTTIIVLITGKRSATIAMALIILVFVFSSMHGKRKIWSTIGILVFVIVLYFIISRYLEGSFLGVVERMSNMREDEGSGRIMIYHDVINVLKDNSFFEWILGRGQGSIRLSQHSNAHNDALQILFEFGIVGLIGYLAFLMAIFRRMAILRKSKSNNYISYAASVIITVMLGLVSNLVPFHNYFAFLCIYWGIVEADLVSDNTLKIIRF